MLTQITEATIRGNGNAQTAYGITLLADTIGIFVAVL